MPANTAKGYPYPVGTDRVMDGDNDIRALAEKVDTRAGVMVSGTAVTGVPGSLNTGVSVAVTFPAGLFTATPAVVVTGLGSVVEGGISVAPTTSGVTVYGSKKSGALVAMTVYWFAHQA